jgi:hypothetical protein
MDKETLLELIRRQKEKNAKLHDEGILAKDRVREKQNELDSRMDFYNSLPFNPNKSLEDAEAEFMMKEAMHEHPIIRDPYKGIVPSLEEIKSQGWEEELNMKLKEKPGVLDESSEPLGGASALSWHVFNRLKKQGHIPEGINSPKEWSKIKYDEQVQKTRNTGRNVFRQGKAVIAHEKLKKKHWGDLTMPRKRKGNYISILDPYFDHPEIPLTKLRNPDIPKPDDYLTTILRERRGQRNFQPDYISEGPERLNYRGKGGVHTVTGGEYRPFIQPYGKTSFREVPYLESIETIAKNPKVRDNLDRERSRKKGGVGGSGGKTKSERYEEVLEGSRKRHVDAAAEGVYRDKRFERTFFDYPQEELAEGVTQGQTKRAKYLGEKVGKEVYPGRGVLHTLLAKEMEDQRLGMNKQINLEIIKEARDTGKTVEQVQNERLIRGRLAQHMGREKALEEQGKTPWTPEKAKAKRDADKFIDRKYGGSGSSQGALKLKQVTATGRSAFAEPAVLDSLLRQELLKQDPDINKNHIKGLLEGIKAGEIDWKGKMTPEITKTTKKFAKQLRKGVKMAPFIGPLALLAMGEPAEAAWALAEDFVDPLGVLSTSPEEGGDADMFEFHRKRRGDINAEWNKRGLLEGISGFDKSFEGGSSRYNKLRGMY